MTDIQSGRSQPQGAEEIPDGDQVVSGLSALTQKSTLVDGFSHYMGAEAPKMPAGDIVKIMDAHGRNESKIIRARGWAAAQIILAAAVLALALGFLVRELRLVPAFAHVSASAAHVAGSYVLASLGTLGVSGASYWGLRRRNRKKGTKKPQSTT